MKTIDIKGKPYIQVHERILHLKNEIQADYSLTTDYTFYEDLRMWVVKATLKVYLHNDIVAGHVLEFTGHAQEIIDDGYINKTSALENCETSAVGRALGMYGIGIDAGFASADEVKKATDREKSHKPWMSEQEKNSVKRLIAEGEHKEAQKIIEARRVRKTWMEGFETMLKEFPEIKPGQSLDELFDKK